MEAARENGGGDLVESALAYARLGWSVIPVQPRGKVPLVSWTEFQLRRAGENEVRAWWQRWPDANVGVVTGAQSGLIVVDIDGPTGEQSVNDEASMNTVECRTGRGRHLYFAHPGARVGSRAGVRPGVDVRGDGGYVVAPPSIHASGRPYEWRLAHEPGTLDLAALPGWVSAIPQLSSLGSPAGAGVWEGVPAGGRNSAAARLAGVLLRRGFTGREVLEAVLAWNANNRPPMDRGEVMGVVSSVARAHARRVLDIGSGEP